MWRRRLPCDVVLSTNSRHVSFGICLLLYWALFWENFHSRFCSFQKSSFSRLWWGWLEMKVNSIHSVSQVRNYVVFLSLETTDFVITIGLEYMGVNMILTRLKIQFRSIIVAWRTLTREGAVQVSNVLWLIVAFFNALWYYCSRNLWPDENVFSLKIGVKIVKSCSIS